MLTTALLLSVQLLQQPGAAPAQTPREAALTASKTALSGVASRVAETRSALGVYRRAVFNGTNDEVLTNANYLRTSCLEVSTAAVRAGRQVCRRCADAHLQAALDRYRAELPALTRMSGQCGARLGQLARGANAAKRLRAEVRTIGNPIVLELRVYESRVGAVMEAMNATPPRPTPRPVTRPARP